MIRIKDLTGTDVEETDEDIDDKIATSKKNGLMLTFLNMNTRRNG